MDLVNFHTHTSRCKHADGSDEEYVLCAIAQGFKVLGFSDHSPWHYENGYIPKSRMNEDQFGDYVTSIRQLKEKYKNQIEIRLGIEAEYFQDKMDWLLQQANLYDIDYIIFGNHFFPTDEKPYMAHNFFNDKGQDAIDAYLENLEKGLKSGIYSYLAHPEVFMRGYEICDQAALNAFEKIAQLCQQYHCPVEYNLTGKSSSIQLGKETYPHHQFWQIAGKYHLDALVGFDAHYPQALNEWMDLYHQGNELLQQCGCHIIDHIEYRKYKK